MKAVAFRWGWHVRGQHTYLHIVLCETLLRDRDGMYGMYPHSVTSGTDRAAWAVKTHLPVNPCPERARTISARANYHRSIIIGLTLAVVPEVYYEAILV